MMTKHQAPAAAVECGPMPEGLLAFLSRGTLASREPDRPAPASDEAREAFYRACTATDRLTRAVDAEFEGLLMETDIAWWTTWTLQRRLEDGSLPLTDFVRLYPLAQKRELLRDIACLSTSIHVRFAWAFEGERRPPRRRRRAVKTAKAA